VGILAEGWVAPLPMGVAVAAGGLAPAPPVAPGPQVGPLYRLVAEWPGAVVLAEFPFGAPAYEIQAVYYAGYHRRPIINGYSGFFPESYRRRKAILANAPDDPDAVLGVLRTAGVTHVIVHEGAYLDGRGAALSRWLTGIGARLVWADGSDRLFALPPAPPG
jgi:hypothetical protein